MLVEPQAERVLGDPANERARLPRRQALLGLAAELRVRELGREHVGATLPQVFGHQLQAPGDEIAKLAELPQRVDQATAQAVDVRTAEGRGDQVDVALGNELSALGRPLQRPRHSLAVALGLMHERSGRDRVGCVEGILQVFGQAVLVVPIPRLRLAGFLLDRETDPQPRAQYRLGAQYVAQFRQADLRRIEILGIGQEGNAGTGVSLADDAHGFEPRLAVAVLEALSIDAAVTLDLHLQPRRERIDHGDSDTVQPAREAVVLVVELAARVQLREDQFHARHLVFRVDVHRHAAAVVDDLHRTVGAQRDLDLPCVPGERLVHGVVHHLLHEVVRTRGVGIHARPSANGIQPGQDLDGLRGVGFRDGLSDGWNPCLGLRGRQATARPGFRWCRRRAA